MSKITDEQLANLQDELSEQRWHHETRLAKSITSEDRYEYGLKLEDTKLKMELVTELRALRSKSEADIVRDILAHERNASHSDLTNQYDAVAQEKRAEIAEARLAALTLPTPAPATGVSDEMVERAAAKLWGGQWRMCKAPEQRFRLARSALVAALTEEGA